MSVDLSVCVYQSLACTHDSSSAVQARITKFETKVQNTLFKITIILLLLLSLFSYLFSFFSFFWGGGRPWTSRSNLTWKSNFTSFRACLHDNLSPISARTTNTGQEMHLSTVKVPIDFGRDNPSASISITIVKSIYLHCFVSHLARPCRKSWDNRWLPIDSVSSLDHVDRTTWRWLLSFLWTVWWNKCICLHPKAQNKHA